MVFRGGNHKGSFQVSQNGGIQLENEELGAWPAPSWPLPEHPALPASPPPSLPGRSWPTSAPHPAPSSSWCVEVSPRCICESLRTGTEVARPKSLDPHSRPHAAFTSAGQEGTQALPFLWIHCISLSLHGRPLSNPQWSRSPLPTGCELLISQLKAIQHPVDQQRPPHPPIEVKAGVSLISFCHSEGHLWRNSG